MKTKKYCPSVQAESQGSYHDQQKSCVTSQKRMGRALGPWEKKPNWVTAGRKSLCSFICMSGFQSWLTRLGSATQLGLCSLWASPRRLLWLTYHLSLSSVSSKWKKLIMGSISFFPSSFPPPVSPSFLPKIQCTFLTYSLLSGECT